MWARGERGGRGLFIGGLGLQEGLGFSGVVASDGRAMSGLSRTPSQGGIHV
jgi:hypothetical protein